MRLSFIIPAYNEEALIEATIRQLAQSARAIGAPFGIIVADDASTDRTAALAAAAGARIVAVNKRQISATRNAGAAAATGDIFIFVDADTLVPEATLRGAIEALKDGAIGGGAAVRFEDVPRFAQLTGAVLVQLFILFRFAAGCFIFCRRSAFEAIGGFDERFFASEEMWISKALKTQGRFVMVRHPVITSGRKIRAHGTARLLWFMFRLTLRGQAALQRREGLDIWYDGRR